MSTSEIATVLAWHDALSSSDLDTLLSLSSPDVEIGDADGAAQGRIALRSWAERSDATVETGDLYERGGTVVVEEQWTSKADPSDTYTTASAFRVVRDHVTSIFRHDGLEAAFDATGLSASDLH
jgi:hypothetical protein